MRKGLVLTSELITILHFDFVHATNGAAFDSNIQAILLSFLALIASCWMLATTPMLLPSLFESVLTVAHDFNVEKEAQSEDFNIFRILDLSTSEVRTHSAFIAELLDPQGSHRMGRLFLDLFLVAFEIPTSPVGNATVTVEKSYGPISDGSIEAIGGRIDILIKFHDLNEPAIVIENKINAADQYLQLARYFNNEPGCCLIYLTPDVRQPKSYSIGNHPRKGDIVCRTYRKHIIAWLLACMNLVKENKPSLYHALQQYTFLIQHLIHNTTVHRMQENIGELLASSEAHVQAAFLVRNSLESMKAHLSRRFVEQLLGMPLEFGFSLKPEDAEEHLESYNLPGLCTSGDVNFLLTHPNYQFKYHRIKIFFDPGLYSGTWNTNGLGIEITRDEYGHDKKKWEKWERPLYDRLKAYHSVENPHASLAWTWWKGFDNPLLRTWNENGKVKDEVWLAMTEPAQLAGKVVGEINAFLNYATKLDGDLLKSL